MVIGTRAKRRYGGSFNLIFNMEGGWCQFARKSSVVSFPIAFRAFGTRNAKRGGMRDGS